MIRLLLLNMASLINVVSAASRRRANFSSSESESLLLIFPTAKCFEFPFENEFVNKRMPHGETSNA